MDKTHFINFSPRELEEIENLKNELKETKLKNFLVELLEKNELDYIQQLVDKKIDFYAMLNTLDILKHSMEIVSSNIFRPSVETAIQHIKNIKDEKYLYIKEMFIDSLIVILKETEKDFLIDEGLTSPQLEGSPYHKKILKIAQQVLLDNPQYVDKFKDISLREFTVLSKVIYLDNKFPEKNIKEKKLKI